MNFSFPVAIYGNLEKYNETISKARCRIFYKYGNRNGTYITDEFAEELLATIPYAPVKGIYSADDEDYTDHGIKRDEGRIYGIVPQNPNLTWETHLDEDGIERTYACVDVYLYTALYKEASEIFSKGQSMELFKDSIVGEWQIINGTKYYVFKKGCFLGLQVLGDNTEPCFEGAAFYELKTKIEDLLQQIDAVFSNMNKEVKKKVDLFKLSDNQKHDAIWTLLNTNVSEDGWTTVDYIICDVYDDYAIVASCNDNTFERVYYKKDDATDSLEIINREPCFIVDVTKAEKDTLDVLQKLNGGTYENLDASYNELKESKETLEANYEQIQQDLESEKNLNCENVTKINELNETISTLNVEKENTAETLATLDAKCAELVEFKTQVELTEKKAILHSYEGKLSKETLDGYEEKISEFTAIELDKELAYELKNSNPDVFSTNKAKVSYTPKDTEVTGIERLLAKYKK